MARLYPSIVLSASSQTSKEKRSAYFDADPRSLSMTAIGPPRPAAMRRDVKVLPEPEGPKTAARNLDWDFVAFLNADTLVSPYGLSSERSGKRTNRSGPRSRFAHPQTPSPTRYHRRGSIGTTCSSSARARSLRLFAIA